MPCCRPAAHVPPKVPDARLPRVPLAPLAPPSLPKGPLVCVKFEGAQFWSLGSASADYFKKEELIDKLSSYEDHRNATTRQQQSRLRRMSSSRTAVSTPRRAAGLAAAQLSSLSSQRRPGPSRGGGRIDQRDSATRVASPLRTALLARRRHRTDGERESQAVREQAALMLEERGGSPGSRHQAQQMVVLRANGPRGRDSSSDATTRTQRHT